jgi:hypothetical protein
MTPRLLFRLLLALFTVGCAHVEPPRGGPEDRTPPSVVLVRPDSLAVVPNWTGPVVFGFDERISEREIEQAVLVSPRTSPVLVERGPTSIRVSLRRGWQPGVIYHVTVRPTVQDLFNNRMTEPVSLVFSTGPEIPQTELSGTVVERITGRGRPDLRVEAIRQPDSLVYAVPTDSAGGFRMPRLPVGQYLVRAFDDMNRNRELDDFEPRDTALVQIAAGDPVTTRLAIVPPDTTPPRLTGATLLDTARVELRFDDYLDPAQEFAPGAVEIVDPTGVAVLIESVAFRAGGGQAGAPAPPGAAEPLPSQELDVRLAPGVTLAPGTTYRVQVRGIRNLNGIPGDSETDLTLPAAAPAPP